MKKPVRIAITAIPIIGALTGTGVFIASKMNTADVPKTYDPKRFTEADNVQTKEGTSDTSSLINKFQIFPMLNSHQFYKYIRLDENHEPTITDEFISRVVNYVIKEMKISDGKIDWGYQMISKKEMNITFKWISGIQGRIFSKTYHFDITKT